MALQDVLARLNDPNSGYGNEVPRVNAMSQAPALAQAVVNWQKKQRALPVMQALEGYGKQYGAAQTDEERQRANAAANLARATYIKSGGSPIDLPQNLWGGDTSQGFQTGEGTFTPPYAGDNLSIGQKLKQAAMTGMFDGQPTWDRTLQEKAEARNAELFPIQKETAQVQLNRAKATPVTGTTTSQSLVKNMANAAIIKSVTNQFGEWWSKQPNVGNTTKEDWEKAISDIENGQIDNLDKLAAYGVTLKDIYAATDALRERQGLPLKYKKEVDNSDGEAFMNILNNAMGGSDTNPQ